MWSGFPIMVSGFAVAAVSCNGDAAPPSAQPSQLLPTVEFYELEACDYTLGGREMRAPPSRLFVNFQPAASANEGTPLFVLSAGGPASTSLFLLSELGPCRVNEGTKASDPHSSSNSSCEPQAHDLTKLGHVLAIDPRNAGFSYEWLADPANPAERAERFNASSYNVYRDAAEHWLVLLDALEKRPALATSPIYFIAESYGALRVTLMLDMLFRPHSYAADDVYFDPGLLEALAKLDSVPSRSRFRGQVLLQPLFAEPAQREVTGHLFEAPGSILHALAEATQTPYAPCPASDAACDPFDNAMAFLRSADRSPYDYRQGYGWAAQAASKVATAATRSQTLAKLSGVSESDLDRLFLGSREHSFRFLNPNFGRLVERGNLEERYGRVGSYDAHFLTLNREAYATFQADETRALGGDPNQIAFAESFLSNLRRLPTLLTRARYDLLVYAPALLPALRSLGGVRDAFISEAPTPTVQVEFIDGASASIPCPEFLSSHSIASDAPAELFDVLGTFVTDTAN